MDLKTVLASLKETECFEDLNPWWDETMLTFPVNRPDFLDPVQVRMSREWSGFEAKLDPLLEETANRIANDPALARLAWYFYWNVFERDGRSWKRSPSLNQALGDRGGIFYLLVTMAFVPRLRVHHQRLGVPEEITRETCQQRAILGYLEAGHTWRNGSMFFLADDIAHFGRQYYRSKWSLS